MGERTEGVLHLQGFVSLIRWEKQPEGLPNKLKLIALPEEMGQVTNTAENRHISLNRWRTTSIQDLENGTINPGPLSISMVRY